MCSVCDDTKMLKAGAIATQMFRHKRHEMRSARRTTALFSIISYNYLKEKCPSKGFGTVLFEMAQNAL
jgi:hypothetical protein